ncbi:MAG: hypothetical protein WCZ01_01235 [Candidatus Neomarinimicrobiota bacterium]
MNRQAKRYAIIVACPSGRLIADKMEIKNFPKSRQGGTSFMLGMLDKMMAKLVKNILKE